MRSYFDSFYASVHLCWELEQWLGTPFMHRAHVKGVGVDCVQLVGQVMAACGVVSDYDCGEYSLDWGDHQERSLIVAYIEQTGRFTNVLTTDVLTKYVRTKEDVLLGDVLTFRVGRCEQHCGIALDALHFQHVLARGSVAVNQLDDITWSSRLAGIYRPLP